jgi:hypothetical protein
MRTTKTRMRMPKKKRPKKMTMVKSLMATMKITYSNLLMVTSKLTLLKASVKRNLTSTTLVRKFLLTCINSNLRERSSILSLARIR